MQQSVSQLTELSGDNRIALFNREIADNTCRIALFNLYGT